MKILYGVLFVMALGNHLSLQAQEDETPPRNDDKPVAIGAKGSPRSAVPS